jgi:hypothetical protein
VANLDSLLETALMSKVEMMEDKSAEGAAGAAQQLDETINLFKRLRDRCAIPSSLAKFLLEGLPKPPHGANLFLSTWSALPLVTFCWPPGPLAPLVGCIAELT